METKDITTWLKEHPAKCLVNGSSRVPLIGKGLHPKVYSSYKEMGLCKDCPRGPYRGKFCIYRRPNNPFNESVHSAGCAGGGQYSEEVLMSCLVRLWQQLGHPPNTAEINNSSAPSASTYYRRYGSLANAKDKARLFMADELPERSDPLP